MLLQIGFGTLFLIVIMVVVGFVLILCDDSFALLTGATILVIAVVIFILCWCQDAESSESSESQTVQEQETESEDLSQLTINGENVAYVDGEVINKLSNNRIQVSIYEETYNIVVEPDVYDTVEVGDTINCVVYHDIAKVNYVTE